MKQNERNRDDTRARALPPVELGWQNMVVHTKARESFNPEHVGPLSIKCAFNGEEVYEAAGGRFAVDDASYLILNGGERYSSSIRSTAEVESFCVFFRPDLVEDILTVLVTPADKLLYDPAHRHGQPLSFFQKLYRHDAEVSPLLLRLRASIENRALTRGWFDDQFPLLLERLLHVHRDVYKQAEHLSAVRGSTRAELYRRLALARDYIDASIARQVDVTQAADVACLSYYHFLRLFRQAFGETPHKYLTRRRLERAQMLLEKTNRTITEICEDIGFESLGSFSWLFRKHVGVSPDRYRRMIRGESK